MAGPTLGTLLIQRLDAALGTTLSQQTQIVNRATSDPVTHTGQTVRPEPVSNSLVRDGRSNVDRATQGAQAGDRVTRQPADTAATTRATGPSVTTSATTSLGLAARIILNLFANQNVSTPAVTARAPLLSTAPQASTGGASAPASSASSAQTGSTTAQSLQSSASTGIASGSDSTTLLSQTLARALTQSLQQSGLFYESHLRTMLSGQYRLSDIRQEPQAQIPTRGARPDPGPAGTQGQTTQTPSQATMARGGGESAGTAGQTTASAPAGGAGSTTQGATATAQGTTPLATQQGPAIPGIDPAAHGLVRQQLETLADQSIHWRGEAWPGAAMDWHIKRHPEHGGSPDTPHDDAEAPWQSEVSIQLPQLGNITMNVRLAGKQVYVTLQTNENTASVLRHHAGQLHDQMTRRQLELTAITFAQPDPESSHAPQAATDTQTAYDGEPPAADMPGRGATSSDDTKGEP